MRHDDYHDKNQISEKDSKTKISIFVAVDSHLMSDSFSPARMKQDDGLMAQFGPNKSWETFVLELTDNFEILAKLVHKRLGIHPEKQRLWVWLGEGFSMAVRRLVPLEREEHKVSIEDMIRRIQGNKWYSQWKKFLQTSAGPNGFLHMYIEEWDRPVQKMSRNEISSHMASADLDYDTLVSRVRLADGWQDAFTSMVLRQFDKDGDGALDTFELANFMKAVGLSQGEAHVKSSLYLSSYFHYTISTLYTHLPHPKTRRVHTTQTYWRPVAGRRIGAMMAS
jgi:hypothetical protein